jgi:plastocyanin
MNAVRRSVCLLGVAAALCANAAWAGTVTVNVLSKTADLIEDTIVVFDPLDATPAPAHDVASIDQVDKRFVPHVSIVRTGTAVTFPNSDHIRHQVYSFSPAKTFSLKLYAGSPRTAIDFDKPGLVVLGCNIHDKMVAFVGVVDSPYFAKVNTAGNAAVNLPAGHYRLRVWNPNLTAAVPPQEVAVQTSPLTLALTINLNSSAAGVAAWPE